MTDYVWELGIDWNAIETAGVSYLRGGLATGGEPLSGTAPVSSDDTITFRIFDVNSSVLEPGRKVAGIGSFVILTKAAVKGQPAGNSLSNLQPAITQDTPHLASTCFTTENVYASWTAQVVNVSVSGRFLLTVQLQATGPDGNVRLFRHDPEMVVGPFG
ncbi:MAG TPA: hypothetical protein VJ725_30810 [Thermoanaerobaculia bacterium]|nr:hypothetical protein [Thermoanaerobaculia bacterium]